MNTLTPLGKFLRKLRIDHAERLADASEAVGVSSAMLSAVELGRKPAPQSLLESIAKHYGLPAPDRAELKRLAEASAPQLRIELTGAADPARELAVAFARKFQTLDPSEVDQMLDLLAPRSRAKEEQ